METKYELNNTKKVANAFGLNEEDTNLLINAVDLDIKTICRRFQVSYNNQNSLSKSNMVQRYKI